MRMSNLFSQTLRESPSEAEALGHKFLLRAGFIRQLASGIYTYLPFARRSLNKIENIIREEMDAIGGQEITMPVVNPADLWQETGRWYSIDAEMTKFKDRAGRDMVLAMTHEEVVADLVRREIKSYRQLPRLIYHVQTKWRDDPRPRGGLIRVREFTMKDSYSLDATWEGLDQQYRSHYQAYYNIFTRCGLPVISVKADVGMMGGLLAHEFMYLNPIGEDTLLFCDKCSYSANRQIALFQKTVPVDEEKLTLEKIATPDCKTIEELAVFLGIPKSRTAKAVFLVANIVEDQSSLDKFVFALVRGDMDVNETKLGNVLKARNIRPASEEEILSTGAQPGYASPIGISRQTTTGMPIVVIVDEIIPAAANLVSGANEDGHHLLNVNYGRDFTADQVADITAAREGDACPECGYPLRISRGVEVGNIFKLGTRYSEAMGCYFSSGEGESRPVIMGSYGIGSGRLLGCIAEEYHDEMGLKLPISVAPFQVQLVLLAGKIEDSNIIAAAEKIYQDLSEAKIEVLYDDRKESPGVKFNDADLIGLPIRLTVSERNLNDGVVEFKRRDNIERENIPMSQLKARVKQEIQNLEKEINSMVVSVDYS